MQRFNSISRLFVSFLFALFLAACGDDAGKSAGSSSSASSESAPAKAEMAAPASDSAPTSSASSAPSGISHDVVYEEEIYKNWPKQ